MNERRAGRPTHHLRAHLGVRLEHVGKGGARGVLELGGRARTSDGQVSLGALATMVDVTALFGAKDAYEGPPPPQVTSHLALRLAPAPVAGCLYGQSAVVRARTTGSVSIVHVSDGDDRVVGVATVTSSTLGGRGGSHDPDVQHDENDFFAPAKVAGDGPPVDEFLAMEPERGRGYRVRFNEILRNVNGVLHGGGGSLIVEQSARRTAADAGLGGAVVDSLEVHFVAPGLAGPFFAAVEPIGAGDRLTVVVRVTDEGRDDRLVVVGVVGLLAGDR